MPEKPILQKYLRRLTRLSGNNRSLLLLRLVKSQMMDLQKLSFLQGKPVVQLLQTLLKKKTYLICPVVDSRMESVNQVSAQLSQLERMAWMIETESGSKDLHLGWPMVTGKFNDGTPVRCALMYFPVRIFAAEGNWHIRLRDEDGITFNRTFLTAYAHYNKVQLQEELYDYTFDEEIDEVHIFLTFIYELLKNKLELNFNPEIFAEAIPAFREFTKEDFIRELPVGKIKVYTEGVLGIFPQSGSRLEPDYEALIANPDLHGPEDFFRQMTTPAHVHEEDLLTPFELDAWQEEGLRKVKSGMSLVVHGPPGTGKSQFLANLVADAVASGKRVLVVSQKRAALDVVFNRLEAIGMAPFLALIHDFKNDRPALYQQLASQVENVELYQQLNRQSEIITTEREFVQVSRQMEALSLRLDTFRHALYDDSQAGITLHELYLMASSNPEVQLPKTVLKPWSEALAFSRWLEKLRQLAHVYHRDHPWNQRYSFATGNQELRWKLTAMLEEIPPRTGDLMAEVQALRLNLQVREFSKAHALILTIEELLGAVTTPTRFGFAVRMSSTALPELSELDRYQQQLKTCYADAGIEPAAPGDPEELHRHLGMFSKAEQRKYHSIKWWVGWIFSGYRKVWHTYRKFHQEEGGAAFQALQKRRLENTARQDELIQEICLRFQVSGSIFRSESQMELWLAEVRSARQALQVLNEPHPFPVEVASFHSDFVTWRQRVNGLQELLARIQQQYDQWVSFLHPAHIVELLASPGYPAVALDSLERDFEVLVAFDAMLEALPEQDREIAGIFLDKNLSGNWGEHFQLAQAFNWIRHLESEQPVLKAASDSTLDYDEVQLRHLAKHKKVLSTQMGLIRLRENTGVNLEYNRLKNRVTYRDLLYQVRKKRHIWPVRKLLENFASEIFQLLPCWLASPETVSAIFPLEPMFDLVLFDEASQCFAEQGIPALYRGRQVVIAGDRQQLRPSGMYLVRLDEEAGEPEAEIESLLELGEYFLPISRLNGHYRSLHPELIDFSNRHFYDSKLQLLPFANVVQQEPAIRYINVQGEWKNKVNVKEAEYLVQEVVEHLKSRPQVSLGIITFNQPQQHLIMDLLRAREIVLHKGFIKNIENVQGDEADIVFFSTGYSPDSNGRVALQFGSLNQSGGVNRLNVAITRAREAMIVITSMEPEQLHTSTSESGGPEMLRSWLYYARGVYRREITSETLRHSLPTGRYLVNALASAAGAQLIQGPLTGVADAWTGFGAILTDDELLHQALHIKQPFVNTPSFLESRGWTWKRVYSRNFWLNRTAVLQKLFSKDTEPGVNAD